jgi:hypothetical protein
MRRVGWCALLLALALSAAPGQDPPKNDKKPTPKERYDALVKDVNAQRERIIAELKKAKGEEEQKKLGDQFDALVKDYADRLYKLAEDEPNDPAAIDALFWVVRNGTHTPAERKATPKVVALVGELPLKDLVRRLNDLRSLPEVVVEAALKRAEKDEADPLAADVLAWVVTSLPLPPTTRRAVDRLLEKYPDSPAIERVCANLGRFPDYADSLKQILEKAAKPRAKAAAALALGQSLAAQADRLGDKPEAEKVAAEAEKYFSTAIELYGKDKAESQKEEAERALNALRTLRVGKEAPEIKGHDLDGREFKLSDYRGKVVLLDFWGDW